MAVLSSSPTTDSFASGDRLAAEEALQALSYKASYSSRCRVTDSGTNLVGCSENLYVGTGDSTVTANGCHNRRRHKASRVPYMSSRGYPAPSTRNSNKCSPVDPGDGPVAVTVMKDRDGCRLLQHLLRVAGDDLRKHIVAVALPDFHRMMTDPLGNYFCQSALQAASEQQLGEILSKCKSHLTYMAKSLYGTRAVQKLVIEICSVPAPFGQELVEQLSNAFLGHICDLATDPCGTHVVRQLLTSLTRPQVDRVHAEIREKLFEISTNKRGYSAVQKCLQTNTPHLRQEMVTALLPYTQRLILDPFGNFIVQCLLNMGDEKTTSHIVEVILINLLKYTNHKFASNVVELCILRSNVYQLGSFVGGFVTLGPDMLLSALQHPFGNYVIQLLLEMTPSQGFSPLPRLIGLCLPQLSLSPQGRRIAQILRNKFPSIGVLPEAYSLWRDLRSSSCYGAETVDWSSSVSDFSTSSGSGEESSDDLAPSSRFAKQLLLKQRPSPADDTARAVLEGVIQQQSTCLHFADNQPACNAAHSGGGGA